MNKDLKGRIFDIPQNILDKINHTIKNRFSITVKLGNWYDLEA